MNKFQTEPVSVTTLLTAAVVATINAVAIILEWSADLTAGLNLAAAAWVAVLGFFLRSRVTPVVE